ncbi:nuclear transport factor 2 family protein [Streptomyces sp. NPDC047971]|uniref:ester cyclase n=1 Tax=Streptomyces sp. NPDC047971 TaxID=3154499 RepID=UPI0033D32C2B
MGEARTVMDRLTEAMTTPDLAPEVIADLFAEDAVAVTPDLGEVAGRDAIVAYLRTMTGSVPDATYTSLHKYEIGDTAIDEGVFSGRNTGPILLLTGETLPPTGREVGIRGVDIATVRNGRIESYRLYYDQMQFMDQLGLLPEA